MNRAPCKYFELEMVDHLLGNLPLHRAAALQAHLAGCERCRKIYEQWRQILAKTTGTGPSPRLYRRLKKAYRQRQWQQRFRWPRLLGGAGVVAAVLLIALAVGQVKKPFPPWEQPAIKEELPLFVVNDPITVSHPVVPQKGRFTRLEGIVWINVHSDEAFFYLQGLEPNANYDYQIWLVKPVEKENGGLLKLTGQSGALHLKRRNIDEVRQIRISREPKGGSLHPTTADTVLVDFKP